MATTGRAFLRGFAALRAVLRQLRINTAAADRSRGREKRKRAEIAASNGKSIASA
jgi:hypothetical protein